MITSESGLYPFAGAERELVNMGPKHLLTLCLASPKLEIIDDLNEWLVPVHLDRPVLGQLLVGRRRRGQPLVWSQQSEQV